MATFLRLGVLGFGGPVAHLGLMRHELVRRRGWLTDAGFLDLVAAANLIPGPNSTELTMYVGRLRGGTLGLGVAGAAFIVPAALVTGVVAWAYVEYGSLPEVRWLLYGLKPVMLAIVVQAVIGLSKSALIDPFRIALAVAVAAGSTLGGNEIVLLFGGALAMAALAAVRASLRAIEPVSLIAIALVFAKIGAILYGSGYVLLAYLRADLVERTGWLSDGQLLDAIVAGQVTPGPVLSTATFVGYLLAGPSGAAVATIAIFLPAFLFVAVSGPFVDLARRSPVLSAAMDGAVVASLALMAVVSVELARSAIVDPLAAVLFAVALVLVSLTRINAAWLVIAGGATGGALGLLAGR